MHTARTRDTLQLRRTGCTAALYFLPMDPNGSMVAYDCKLATQTHALLGAQTLNFLGDIQD